MTPREASAALATLKKEVGITAFTDLTINPDYIGKDGAVMAVLYPHGLGASDSPRIHVEAETLEDAIEKLRAMWVERKAVHEAETIKKMALAIIRVTDECGECSESALRNEFDPGLVKRFSEAACARADEMAGRGPFSVVRTQKSNAA